MISKFDFFCLFSLLLAIFIIIVNGVSLPSSNGPKVAVVNDGNSKKLALEFANKMLKNLSKNGQTRVGKSIKVITTGLGLLHQTELFDVVRDYILENGNEKQKEMFEKFANVDQLLGEYEQKYGKDETLVEAFLKENGLNDYKIYVEKFLEWLIKMIKENRMEILNALRSFTFGKLEAKLKEFCKEIPVDKYFYEEMNQF